MEKGQEMIRLRIYEVYAWGMPIIITVVAAILDNLPENPNETFLRPRFGENKCWFYGECVCVLKTRKIFRLARCAISQLKVTAINFLFPLNLNCRRTPRSRLLQNIRPHHAIKFSLPSLPKRCFLTTTTAKTESKLQ